MRDGRHLGTVKSTSFASAIHLLAHVSCRFPQPQQREHSDVPYVDICTMIPHHETAVPPGWFCRGTSVLLSWYNDWLVSNTRAKCSTIESFNVHPRH